MQLVKIEAKDIANEVIVKIHGRCNLACDYCYVYEGVDQSWRTKPRQMSRDTMKLVAKRIAGHLREHRLASMRVVIHGGEPLLAGIEDIACFVRACREEAPPDRELLFGMQTNGTLLTTAIIDALGKLEVAIAISLDGDEDGNSHRPLRSGKSSYEAVRKALSLFEGKRQAQLPGLLGVVHLENDPIVTYDHLAKFGARLDLLWPLGNWQQPPEGVTPGTEEAPYGRWLAAVFDHAYTRGGPPPVRVRLIDQIILLLQSVWFKVPFPPSLAIDLIGPWGVGAIVIEVDGTYELLDGYKTVAAGENWTGLDVYRHSLTAALAIMLRTTEARGINQLPTPCGECGLKEVCGGGYYLTRYDADGSYDHPSVYCDDLTYLILHIDRAIKKLGRRILSERGA